MLIIKTVVLGAFVCLALGQSTSPVCFAQTEPTEDKRATQLANERKKLDRTTNPQNRAESLMKIAEINLSYIKQAAGANDFPKLESYAVQYQKAVSDAHDAMMRSGLDPARKPRGFKNVEIALRKQIRVLQDIGRLLTLEDRKPIEATLELVTQIRADFIQALFGGLKTG